MEVRFSTAFCRQDLTFFYESTYEFMSHRDKSTINLALVSVHRSAGTRVECLVLLFLFSFHPAPEVLLNAISITHLVIKKDNEKRKRRKTPYKEVMVLTFAAGYPSTQIPHRPSGLILRGTLSFASHFADGVCFITCVQHRVSQGVARYVFLV